MAPRTSRVSPGVCVRRHAVPVLSLAAFTLLADAAVAQPFGPSGPEFRVNTYTSSYQVTAALATNGSGEFLIVWHSSNQDGSGPGIFAQRFSPQLAPAGVELRVNTTTTGPQANPKVAGSTNEAFIVTWSGPASEGRVYEQRFTDWTTPIGSEFRVNTFASYSYPYGSVAADFAGHFVVAWAFTGGGQDFIFAQRQSFTGDRLGPEFRVNTDTSSKFVYPVVAEAPNSAAFVVVWMISNANGALLDLRGQRFDELGAPAGTEFRINSDTTHQVIAFNVSVAESGEFVVVWTNRIPPPPPSIGPWLDVYAQRYAASGAPLGGNFRVNTTTSGAQDYPRVAHDAQGRFLVVWTGNRGDGNGFDVFAQSFAAAGNPLGGEFRVNTYTTGHQVSPAVAYDHFGYFVVAWSSQHDGDSYGIFAQQLCLGLAGDADGNGLLNVSDVLYLINNLFAGGPLPLRDCDVNGDTVVNVSDVLYLINHLFAGGPAPRCALFA